MGIIANVAGATAGVLLILGALTATAAAGSECYTADGSCAVGSDARELAAELVEAARTGELRLLYPEVRTQLLGVAAGTPAPNCGVDVGTLQVMVLALRTFETVGVSSLNRLCVGDSLGTRAHWADGGGNAVDFYAFDGRVATGADSNSLRFIGLLDQVMPVGSRIGQSNCRAAAGVSLSLTLLSEIADSCDHLHVDVLLAAEKRFPIG